MEQGDVDEQPRFVLAVGHLPEERGRARRAGRRLIVARRPPPKGLLPRSLGVARQYV